MMDWQTVMEIEVKNAEKSKHDDENIAGNHNKIENVDGDDQNLEQKNENAEGVEDNYDQNEIVPNKHITKEQSDYDQYMEFMAKSKDTTDNGK